MEEKASWWGPEGLAHHLWRMRGGSQWNHANGRMSPVSESHEWGRRQVCAGRWPWVTLSGFWMLGWSLPIRERENHGNSCFSWTPGSSLQFFFLPFVLPYLKDLSVSPSPGRATVAFDGMEARSWWSLGRSTKRFQKMTTRIPGPVVIV